MRFPPGATAVVAIAVALMLFSVPFDVQGQEGGSSAAASESDPDDLFADEDLQDDDLFADEDLQDDDLFADEEPTEDSAQRDSAEAPDAESEGGALGATDAASDAGPGPELEEEGFVAGQRGPTEGVEEILVEGQTTGAIDVEAPVSATSFDASDLEALGVGDISDLAAYTPNTEIRTTGATTPTFFIRGVGLNDFTANGEGAIAIYQDDVVLSLPAIQLGQLFDVQDVNVLRGPQGTGPARNASGGAIQVISKRPSGETQGFLRSEFGRYSYVDVEGALEVPVVPDVLSTRISFRVEERDPFVRNGCATDLPLNLDDLSDPVNLERVSEPNRRSQPPICSENARVPIPNPNPPPNGYSISAIKPGLDSQVNDTSRWAARALVRFQPQETDLDILLNVHFARVDQLYTVGQSIGTDGSFVTEDGERVTDFFGGNSRGYRPDEIINQQRRIERRLGIEDTLPLTPERQAIQERAQRILSRKLAENLDDRPYFGDYNNPGRERMQSWGSSLAVDWEGDDFHLKNIVAFEDYDRFRDQDADYSSRVLFEARVQDRAWQASEDLRLSGELDDYPVQWEVGALFLMKEFDNDRRDDGGNNVIDVRVIYNEKTIGGNVFAKGIWEFFDDFSLEGGVRYNMERKIFDQRLFRASLVPRPDAARPCKPPTTPVEDCDADQLEHAPTGSLSLTYHAADELTFYWKYSRGWKSAQFSAGGATSIFRAAKPETVDSFEVGTSGSWFDGRLSARASAFHYTYSDYHVFITRSDASTPPVREVVNADDALLYGAEIEATLEPFDDFVVNLRGGWIESEFLDFSLESFTEIPQQPPAAPIATLVEQDYTGNRLPNTPRFTFSGSVEYTWELWGHGSLTPRWDFTWTDDVYFDQTDGRGNPNADNVIFMPDLAIGQRDYWLHNVRLAYRTPAGGVEIAGWVRNVADKRYKALAFDASAAGFVGNIVGDPRTYGVTIGLSW
jgi:outer membrane receptor protein involved in Fe transport